MKCFLPSMTAWNRTISFQRSDASASLFVSGLMLTHKELRQPYMINKTQLTYLNINILEEGFSMPRCSEKYSSRNILHLWNLMEQGGGIWDILRHPPDLEKRMHTPKVPHTKICFSVWSVDKTFSPWMKRSKHLYEREQTKMPQVIDVFFTKSKPFFKHWMLLEKV